MPPALAAELVELAAIDGAGAARLSPKEEQALALYASGLPMKGVARQMGIAPDLATCYIDRVKVTYVDAGREARTKAELVHRAVQDELLPAVTRPRSAS